MMYSYTLLVPMNQRVLNKLRKEYNISDHVWPTTQSAQISQKEGGQNICAIVQTMCPTGWLCGNSCTWAHNVRLHIAGTNEPKVLDKLSKEHNISDQIVFMIGRAHCFHDFHIHNGRAHCFHYCIYIMAILVLWYLSTLCIVDHLWSLILSSLLNLLNTLWFIGTSNVWPCIMCPRA